MIFAWEGFSLQHPEDWAPLTLSGNRREGYARISSPGRLALQVRWKHKPDRSDPSDLAERLSAYFSKLSADARKAKVPFDSGSSEASLGLEYHYKGANFGRGAIFWDEATTRVFFIEVTSSKHERFGSVFKDALNTFTGGEERWALFGLDVDLPGNVTVQKKAFLSGKTELRLGTRGVELVLQRWGMAEQLVCKHGLERWARNALDMQAAAATASQDSVALVRELPWPRLPEYGLVKWQPDRNQLTAVKVSTRKEEWRPQWDWIH